ncbi:MAG: hypothetical protein PHO85_04030 [Candidatus Cloacimonetes bacterium]|nr:hypothetical protein [Candidatus Cloacimonadota bacterium]
MKSIDLIFTVDYEIHGNGQGRFEDFCYRPTEKMLDIANEYGAKVTLMVEMEHYFAMKDRSSKFNEEIELFEKQLKRAILEGHDVQLHLHPQWKNAKLIDGKWDFPYTAKEISLLCDDYEYARERISKSKKWLDGYLRQFSSSYECIGFRAGYFQIQPSQKIIQAMLDCGVVCDTSVVRGMCRDNEVGTLDFSKIGSNVPYFASLKDVSIEDSNSPFLEFPIATRQYNNVKKKVKKCVFGSRDVTAETIVHIQRSKLSNNGQIIGIGAGSKEVLQRTAKFSFKNITKREYLDFCIGSPRVLIDEVQKAARRNKNDFTILFIGHSKDFVYSNHFRRLLTGLSFIQGCSFMRLQDAIRKYSKYGV